MSSRLVGALALSAGFWMIATSPAAAFTIQLSNTGFDVSPSFSQVTTFSFSIQVAGPLAPGLYTNPVLDGVEYTVRGSLAPGTPSGFPAFFLQRTISGSDFYAQGSSLGFEISGSADLGDGLQLSELVGADPVFLLNAREVDTGRYHPPLFQLNGDGTGSIRNSNNMGGVNPATGEVVNVDFGDEYISQLGFDPQGLTLVVPEPSTALLLASGLVGLALRQRR